MLHGVARLRLVEEEGHLPFVEGKLRGEVDPKLLVPREQPPDRRQEIGADARLGNMQHLRQFLRGRVAGAPRSEEHTSELQSRQYLVCRLLLEKKKTRK